MDYEETIILSKIDKKEDLTEDELSFLVFETEVEREYGDNNRWSRSVYSIIELEGRFFSIVWENGLTEYQPNEFYNQPKEVSKKVYEKVVQVTEWIPITKEV